MKGSVLCPWECRECNEKTAREWGREGGKTVAGLLGMRYEMRQCSVAGTPRLSHQSWVDIPQLFQLEQIMSGSGAYRFPHIAHSTHARGQWKEDPECNSERLTRSAACNSSTATCCVLREQRSSFLLIYWL